MVITVSREAESGGDEIARIVAERESLQLADKAILERIAQQEGSPLAHLLRFDEAVPGAIEALIAEWQTSVSQAAYLRRLVSVLLLLEHEDSVLIMGRGGAFVLTDPGTFHLRIIAPMPCRVARLMQARSLSAAEAERTLRRRDDERARFVHQAFRADIREPSNYDLVINTAELTVESAADTVILAARHKSAQRRITAEAQEAFLSQILHARRRAGLPRVSEVTWEYYRRRRVI